jgi:hypothetical protein
MAAKIGVLGETTTVTASTIAVYTVPASKAAKVRLMWWIQAPSTCRIRLLVNGATIFDDTSGGTEFTASAAAITAPATGVVLAFTATDPIPATTHVLSPLPVDYYLSAGDTVQLIIGAVDATTVRVQVVGVEDDA